VDEHGYLGNPLTAAAAGGERDYDADESIYAAQLAFKKLIPSALLELMYIHKNDQDSRANSAIATGYAVAGDRTVQIHDIGARLDGKVHGLNAIDYTLEAHGQFGDYADQDQEAWAFAGRVGYTCKNVAWKPRNGNPVSVLNMLLLLVTMIQRMVITKPLITSILQTTGRVTTVLSMYSHGRTCMTSGVT